MLNNKLKKAAIANYKKVYHKHEGLVRELNDAVVKLYTVRKRASNAIRRVETYINSLAHAPQEFKKDIGKVELSLQEFRDAVAFEQQSNQANITGAGIGTAGVAGGAAVAAVGPTAAMAIATAFGTASTGTAISALSGAAATNAALAWLGGGALATGGGGMAAGNAFLALAGPVGWGVGAAAVIGGGIYAARQNKKAALQADGERLKLQHENVSLSLKIKQISILIPTTQSLCAAIDLTEVVNQFPSDYCLFTSEQKQKLAALVNATKALGEVIAQKIV